MMLTLSLTTPALVKRLSPDGLLGAPRVVREEFGLSGLHVASSLLKGADRTSLARFRDAADRAGCACLVLVEPPLPLASTKARQGDKAEERVLRLVEAASLLGCNSLAVGVSGETGEEAFESAVDRLRVAAEAAEKRELNVLIAPTEGLTEDPARVAELIKRVGGFRIGTYPDFETASRAEDPATYLRRLAPYAWAVSASTLEFEEPTEKAPADPAESTGDEELDALVDMLADPPVHIPYDLEAMVGAIASVGYDGTLAIDYRGDAGTLGIRQSCEALEAALERLA
jgi:sugar phosphate isomerase/epimerase